MKFLRPIANTGRSREQSKHVWTKLQDDVIHPAVQKPTFNLLVNQNLRKSDEELDEWRGILEKVGSCLKALQEAGRRSGSRGRQDPI